MKTKIAVTSFASLSPLGSYTETAWEAYGTSKTTIASYDFDGQKQFAAKIPAFQRQAIETLRHSEPKYKALDETVLLAILVARQAVKQAGWHANDTFGINIGSSRGATQLFEKYHQEFIETGKTATLASPTTTLGNIASWVARDLKTQGPEISHSITCATALHAVLNAVAWLQSGMANKFLVGGSEAPLTPFTLAQMHALKIYAKDEQEYPCRAFDLEKTKNTMVLGEAAAVACLETGISAHALAYIAGIGYATDTIEHNTSISMEADCFQKSMKMALQETPLEAVDVVVLHAPGTIKGDASEYRAIQKVFGDQMPLLTTNKWKVGHTFGASGMLNIELALIILQHQQFIGIPYVMQTQSRSSFSKILINAVGFGGNAVSILLSKTP
ncbi:beta-ketoacyl synthase N-terminal-like domain-containing protein [Flavobacterium aciduliphilum]|uniref:3-oxoacyl-(Acyl-carrier-protein) synthase n=1 Tax=Flavobacterium aciduliphilum TaxID=1101402 RepID=A0A328YEZ2_9FLAO|nr:beta-ketoacyl synthase N-terminal-like domain-containing protein [Flavobacterium aciduliphilum]RAR72568.1 3-oxoacyl-(acyl-carrier-protein) synthase [Flavobacterium aciduliphilum]